MLREEETYTSAVVNRNACSFMRECSGSAQLMICVVDRWGKEEYMPVHAVGQMVEDGHNDARTIGAVVFYHVEGREPIEGRDGDE